MIDNEKIAIDYAGVHDFTQMKFDVYKVDVVVFSDKEHHDDYLRQINMTEDEIEWAWAAWHSYAYKIDGMGMRKGDPNLGRLSFVKGHINIEVVSHEITHMVNMWIEMTGMSEFIESYDEHIAIMTGRFYKRFYDWFYTVGLDK